MFSFEDKGSEMHDCVVQAEALAGLCVTLLGRPDDKSSRKVDFSLTHEWVFEQPRFPVKSCLEKWIARSGEAEVVMGWDREN